MGPRARFAAALAREHLTASLRWVVVVLAAALYGVGLAGYLSANAAGLAELVAGLTAADPAAFGSALDGGRFGVSDVLAYGETTGLVDGVVPTAATVLLLGVGVLPATVAATVSGLRRTTNWRASYVYVVGAAGPAASVLLAAVLGPATAPVTSLPLVVDLVLLVAYPAIAVTAFLAWRLVVAAPLVGVDAAG